MKILVRLKSTATPQGFVSASYIGDLIQEDTHGNLKIENTCCLYEIPVPTKTGGVEIKVTYYSSFALSNGVFDLRPDDVQGTREVSEDDELLGGYREALNGLEKHKVQARSGLIMGDKN